MPGQQLQHSKWREHGHARTNIIWQVYIITEPWAALSAGILSQNVFFYTEGFLRLPRNGNDIPPMTSICNIILLHLRFIQVIAWFFLFSITAFSQIVKFKYLKVYLHKHFQLLTSSIILVTPRVIHVPKHSFLATVGKRPRKTGRSVGKRSATFPNVLLMKAPNFYTVNKQKPYRWRARGPRTLALCLTAAVGMK